MSQFKVNSKDKLILFENGSFQYDIESVNIHSKGTWNYSNNSLHFTYLNPPIVRHFDVDFLSNRRMVMHEDNQEFEFIKDID